jgi:hypothetical protein
MLEPALSPQHVLDSIESTFGPIKMLLSRLDQSRPDLAASVRAEILGLAKAHMEKNVLVQPYLMSRAIKNA